MTDVDRMNDKEALLSNKLANLPAGPGVYMFKNSEGALHYVGKAAVLKARVSSYFRTSADLTPRTLTMIEETVDMEWISTDNEVEALLLENTLIKKHKPRYNVRLRDDKTYPFLRLSVNEEFPRLSVTRKLLNDGAKYYGPYYSAKAMRSTLRLIHRYFGLCSSKKEIDGKADRPCLNYQLGWCRGACIGRISVENYDHVVKEVKMLLEGRNDDLLHLLREKMRTASEELRFEDAAKLRDQIQAVEQATKSQKVFDPDGSNQDVAVWKESGVDVLFNIFHIRKGKMIGRDRTRVKSVPDIAESELIGEFIKRYYNKRVDIPHEVILPASPADEELLAEWLSSGRKHKVRFIVPKRGTKARLLKMVRNDLATFIKYESLSQEIGGDRITGELKKKLGLKKAPNRIEGYDISNIGGVMAVGSCVSFQNGKPLKSGYKRFKIKWIDQADDYAMMMEMLYRRISRREQKGWEMPDLILIDGGRGHLNAAMSVLKRFNLKDQQIISLAKIRKSRSQEGIFLPDKELIIPEENTPKSFQLLQRVRDEAHRFAVTYHRKLRDKINRKSILDEIPGIGPKRKTRLLKHFGSLSGVKEASLNDIRESGILDEKTAENVVRFFTQIKEKADKQRQKSD